MASQDALNAAAEAAARFFAEPVRARPSFAHMSTAEIVAALEPY